MPSIVDYLSDRKKFEVWSRAERCSIQDPGVWRLDAHGLPVKWDDYGDRSSPYGWELDHYPIPKSLGGSDEPRNLRVLRCQTNASHGGILGAFLNAMR